MSATLKSGSGVPPLNKENKQSRDGSATLPAPTGRKDVAQGKERGDAALGHEFQNTSSPEGATEGSDLPKGWRWVTLGEVAESMKNGIYKPASFYADDGLACLRMYNIEDGRIVWRDIKRMRLSEEEVREYELLPGDLLVNRVNSRELVGKTAAITAGLERCVFESKNIRVRLRRDLASPEFVSYRFLSAGSAYFTQNAQQVVGMASISQPQVARFPLPLPPLEEQSRIVAEIEKQFTRLEAGVVALRRVQANLKRYRAAVLKAACEGKLVPTEAELAKIKVQSGSGVPPLTQSRDGSATRPATFETGEQLLQRILTERRKNWTGRGKYKEPVASHTANLPSLPEGWTWSNLDAAIVSGPQNGVYLPRELYGCGHAILRIDDYQDGWVRGINELNKVAADQVTVTKYQLLSGDLVINRVNSLTHLGKCLVVHDAHAGALFESNMMKARLNDCVNPRYVEFYLRSRDGRTRLTSAAKWAVNQASINQEDVKRTPLPLPPLAEQTRIVAEVERRLSVVEELEAVVSANLQRATRLRQSILQKAFTGQLVASL